MQGAWIIPPFCGGHAIATSVGQNMVGPRSVGQSPARAPKQWRKQERGKDECLISPLQSAPRHFLHSVSSPGRGTGRPAALRTSRSTLAKLLPEGELGPYHQKKGLRP